MAAALQPQPRHAIGHAEVFHPARMRAEVRPDPVECALDARVDVERVQAVQQQQALHQRVLGQLGQHRRAGLALLAQHRDDLAEAVAVQADQQADQFLGGRGYRPARGGPQCGEQFLHPCADLLNAGHPLRLRLPAVLGSAGASCGAGTRTGPGPESQGQSSVVRSPG